MISILIATKGRSEKIIPCIAAILRSTTQTFEIIIIDQSLDTKTQRAIEKLNNNKILYIPTSTHGKSTALNIGISHARGAVVAFTDDDCIVSKQWLYTMQKSFTHNLNISAVYGKTLPYKPYTHQNQICPCTFTNKKSAILTRPRVHYKHIGFGNNMAIRTSVFKKLGGFKEWLGPGSIGSNAEDAEIALRLLAKAYKILYNPHAVVYHDKWLTREEMNVQKHSYICGEMACYGYFHFQGYTFATDVLQNTWTQNIEAIKSFLKRGLSFKWNRELYADGVKIIQELLFQARGLCVGFIHAGIDPVLKHTQR